MQTTTASLDAAIESPQRVLGHVIEVDWDGDGYNGAGTIDDVSRRVQSVKMTQNLTTNVPEQVRVVSGAAVAQCDVVLGQGNVFTAPVSVSLRDYATSATATGVASSSLSVARPSGARPGDVLLLVITQFDHDIIAGSEESQGLGVIEPNVTWGYLDDDMRSDGAYFYSTILLTRRVLVDDPASYTFTLAFETAYTAELLCVGDANIMGVHALTVSSRDTGTASFSTVTGEATTTTIDGCTLINVYQTLVSVTPTSWSFDADETSVLNVSSVTSGERVTTGVSQRANVPAGTYTASATITQSGTPITAEVATVWTIALAPQVAGNERQTALWTYSELNVNGPLAGKQRDSRPMRWSVAFATANGIETVPVFTGRTLGTSSDRSGGTVTLTALDHRELFRNRASLPFLVREWLRPVSGETDPYAPGLETTWLVSYILGKYWSTNRIGFYASPPAREGTACYVPCHGSLTPFIGNVWNAYTQRASSVQRPVRFDWGPFVGATEKAPWLGKISAYLGGYYDPITYEFDTAFFVVGTPGYSRGRIEFYAKLDTIGVSTVRLNAVIYDHTTYAQIAISVGGDMELTLSFAGVAGTISGPYVPTDGEWHAYGVHWDSQTGAATFRVDDTDTGASFSPMSGAVVDDFSNFELEVTNRAQIAEVHFTGGVGRNDTSYYVTPSSPWVWENFTPTAFIDRSQNELVGVVYDPSTQDEWAILNALAEAELAAVYFDALGYPHYRTGTSNTNVAGNTVVRDVTVVNSLIALDYVANITQIANDITVGYSVPDMKVDEVLWQPNSIISIPPKTSVVISFKTAGQVFQSEVVNIAVGNGNTSSDGTGTVLSYEQFYPTLSINPDGFSGTLTIANLYGTYAWLVDTNGANTVEIRGSFIRSGSTSGVPVNYTDSRSIARHKSQPLQVSNSEWRQTESASASLAVKLLSDLAEITPVLRNIKIVGDPRLQIGDRIRLVDLVGLGVDDVYRITGISPSVDSGGAYTCEITARGSRDAAVWNQNSWNDGTVWGA